MACQTTGNDSADHSISSNNMTDIEAVPQIEFLFFLFQLLGLLFKLPSQWRAVGFYFKMFFFVPVKLANNTSVPSFDIFFRHLQRL